MPAVGSQMLSDVSSGIPRYTTITQPAKNTDTSRRTPATRLPVHSQTTAVSTESEPGASANVPERRNSILKSIVGNEVEVEGEKMNLVEPVAGGQTSGMWSRDAAQPISLLEKVRATQGIWFLPDVDRQTAEIYLRNFQIGVFIIRASSLARTLALSLNIPRESGDDAKTSTSRQRVEHYLIETAGHQHLSLEGSELAFPKLPDLVNYYTQNRNELPIPLRLPCLIDQVERREDLLLLSQVANPEDFWTTTGAGSRQSFNIDTRPNNQSPSVSTTSALSFSMLLDAVTKQETCSSSSLLPLPSDFAGKLRDSIPSSPDSSTSGNISAEEPEVLVLVNGLSGLSSKVSDYEDVWSLADTKSPDCLMSSSFDVSSPDRSCSLEFRDSEPGRAKAVGLALRDLDALGDWIESELHDQRLSPKGTALSTPSTPDNNTENCNPDSTSPLKDENRVIRRGKRRFAGPKVSARNRFSAPNLGVNVEDLMPETLVDDIDLNNSTNAESIYSSVRDLSESAAPEEEAGLPADDFVCYTPPRKCVPCKDPNILEAFQSKVGALKRIGSKLLARKSSLKTLTSHGTLPRDSPTPTLPEQAQERVLVFRTKKAGYDNCWPVDNNNWNVINRATPTISDISCSGTSSSTGSAGAKSASADVNMNGKYLTIRSSKSPAGSLPKRSKTFSDFSDPSRDLEREISLERTINFVVKDTKSDFSLSLQINDFLHRFAATPSENPDQLFGDLRLFLETIQVYFLSEGEHRTNLEDFMSRDLMGSPELKRPSNLRPFVVAAFQRLVVEPLCPKLVWNLQNKLGTSGEFSRMEKGCAIFEATPLGADDIKPEIEAAVIEKLSALTSHFKSLAEAQNLLTKAKQLFKVFSDIFGIEADPLEYSFSDTISAFAMAIAKAKAYNVEVHLDFIWQLLMVDGARDTYFPVLLAASCAATVLKAFATDSKIRLSEAVAHCMVPVSIAIKSREDCPVISHNFQVPLDERLQANQLSSLLACICDLPIESSDMTLRLSTGCLGFVQSGEVVLKAALDRWRPVFADCKLAVLVHTRNTD